MEKIIHFTVPENISSAQAEVIDHARKLHPSWEIKVWRDPVQSDGFLLEKYWSKAKSGAAFADLLRLDVLHRFGGVYVDSDLKLIKPLDDLVAQLDFFVASEDGYYLTNALVGARKESPILRQLIDELINAEPDWTLPPNITTGPHFFSRQLKWRKDVTVLSRESFYPYHPPNHPNFSGQKNIHRHSYGEHLWAHSWQAVPPASKESMGGRNRLIPTAVEFLKKCVKQTAIHSFRAWHRLQSFDPLELSPRVSHYQCSPELVVQTIHGFRIVVDGNDLSLTPELVFNGFYELAEQNFLKNTVTGGDWVIDVGSNIGSFSLLAAQKVGPYGRVFAFEPNPRPYELMAKSLVMNWMHDRVIQRPVAVGQNRGTVKMSILSNILGGGQLMDDNVTGSTFAETLKTLNQETATILEVPCVRLDEEFPIDLPIKLLKIDVEGYEADVLEGADRLLRQRCVDFIQLELSEEVAGSRWYKTVIQVRRVLDYGYKACTILHDGTLLEQKDLAAAIRSGYRNMVLVAQEQYTPA